MNEQRSYIRPQLRGVKPYSTPVERPWITMHLDANEALSPLGFEFEVVRLAAANANRYVTPAAIGAKLARRWGVEPPRVIVTAGADEAIDRLCRACIETTKNGKRSTVILPTPTFEMIGRFAMLAGAELISPEWAGEAFPVDEVVRAIDEHTAMVAVVSPNNPTGAAITEQEFRRVAECARQAGAVVLLDHAYAEFADADLTGVALEYGNVVTMRTFSKAWGLAGLRVGYAIGSEEIVTAMRAVGCPFPVSRLSLAAVGALLDSDDCDRRVHGLVEHVKSARGRLTALLDELGSTPRGSQGNFVLARFENAEWIRSALGSLGIAVRIFKGGVPGASTVLDNCLRIGCPENLEYAEFLFSSLRAAMKPEAILFDMDGVLADVSRSYRAAIIQTAESFGVHVTPEDVARIKAAGDANNDWIVTHRLIAVAGRNDVTLRQVTDRFQSFYLGSPEKPGLETTETLIPSMELLKTLALRTRLGVVTGRPRDEAQRFLRRFGLEDLFETVVCMEDARAKPDPAPVRRALEQMNVSSAWLIGDTPDDIVAARAAGVVPIAIVAPSDRSTVGDAEERATLERHGPAIILDSLDQLTEMLP